MPKFFFDVYDGRQISCDAFGDDFSTAREAREQATSLLPDLARDLLPGGSSHDFAAVVRDDQGDVVYRGMLLYRELKADDADTRWRVTVSGLQCEIARSAELRRETREIGRDIRNGLHGLMATLEDARATMDVSVGLIPRRTRGGGS